MGKAKKRMRNRSDRQKMIDKIDKVCGDITRLIDRVCQKCGAPGPGLHSSHVKSKGKYSNLRFDLLNLIALCYKCHLHWWHKEPTESGKWFKKKFPERLKYLEKHKSLTEGIKTDDLPDILKDRRQKLKELQNEIFLTPELDYGVEE